MFHPPRPSEREGPDRRTDRRRDRQTPPHSPPLSPRPLTTDRHPTDSARPRAGHTSCVLRVSDEYTVRSLVSCLAGPRPCAPRPFAERRSPRADSTRDGMFPVGVRELPRDHPPPRRWGSGGLSCPPSGRLAGGLLTRVLEYSLLARVLEYICRWPCRLPWWVGARQRAMGGYGQV